MSCLLTLGWQEPGNLAATPPPLEEEVTHMVVAVRLDGGAGPCGALSAATHINENDLWSPIPSLFGLEIYVLH